MENTKPSILLVDDNDTDNLITKRILELTGFSSDVHVCNTGASALDWLLLLATTQRPLPHWIFLDINMPLMDGFTFLDEYEKLLPETAKTSKIVILSSSDNPSDIAQMLGKKYVDGFVTKPLTEENLLHWRSNFIQQDFSLTG
jgi:CheY-like chemotaxis protein